MNSDDMRAELKGISTELSHINVTLGRQEVQLAEHIRRTELLEHDMIPIRAHVMQVNGALKLIGLLSLIAGILGTIISWAL